jgi:hypothetical protein
MRTPPTPAFPVQQRRWKVAGQQRHWRSQHPVQREPGVHPDPRQAHHSGRRPDSSTGYDNYFQTNIASGAFAFGGNWTTPFGGVNDVTNSNFRFRRLPARPVAKRGKLRQPDGRGCAGSGPDQGLASLPRLVCRRHIPLFEPEAHVELRPSL